MTNYGLVYYSLVSETLFKLFTVTFFCVVIRRFTILWLAIGLMGREANSCPLKGADVKMTRGSFDGTSICFIYPYPGSDEGKGEETWF